MSTNEIATYAEKVHEWFPQVPVVEIATYGSKNRAYPFCNWIINTNLTNIAGREIVNFILKINEKFPVNPLKKCLKYGGMSTYKNLKSVNTYIYYRAET